MAIKVKPVALWRREIENEPGAVANVLENLRNIDLQVVMRTAFLVDVRHLLSFDWTSTPAETAPSRYSQCAGSSHHRISLIDTRRFTLHRRTVAARTGSDQIADKKHGYRRLANSAENRENRPLYAGGSR